MQNHSELNSSPGHVGLDERSRRVGKFFYSVLFSIFITLEATLALFIINWHHAASVALFFVLSFIFLISSYGTARQLVSLVTGYRSLPSLHNAPAGKHVAMLYTTMNDVVPECLDSISQTYPCDVFILDDSTDEAKKRVVDTIASVKDYRIIRRSERKGYKAGAINNWFLKFGADYDYIVLLDSDSYLPSDWVEEALKFAEHPSNGNVAVFQGMINIWNLDTRFVTVQAPMSRIGQFTWEEKLANELDAVFCYGHNVMIRMDALRQIEGFVEGYVSEDFATAVSLSELGWKTRFVPLHTYEAMPENVRGFIRRQNKWTRGAMEFFTLSRKGISRGKKFILLQTPLGHITNLLMPVGMFLTIYGFSSTKSGASGFISSFISNPLQTYWSVPILRFVLLSAIFFSAISAAVRFRTGIGYVANLRYRLLSAAISSISIPYEIKSMLSYIVTGLKNIPVTPKNEDVLSFREVLSISRYSLIIEVALFAGIAYVNPLGGVFNLTWLVPMMVAPVVITRMSRKEQTHPLANEMSARKSTCLYPDPAGVHRSLAHPLSTHDPAGTRN